MPVSPIPFAAQRQRLLHPFKTIYPILLPQLFFCCASRVCPGGRGGEIPLSSVGCNFITPPTPRAPRRPAAGCTPCDANASTYPPRWTSPDGAVAGSAKRLASRFYQLKTGHARTGQYLHWAKVRPDAQCWRCNCPSQTRDHLFKVCPEWKVQQKILWAEVLKETGERAGGQSGTC